MTWQWVLLVMWMLLTWSPPWVVASRPRVRFSPPAVSAARESDATSNSLLLSSTVVLCRTSSRVIPTRLANLWIWGGTFFVGTLFTMTSYINILISKEYVFPYFSKEDSPDCKDFTVLLSTTSAETFNTRTCPSAQLHFCHFQFLYVGASYWHCLHPVQHSWLNDHRVDLSFSTWSSYRIVAYLNMF